MISAASEAAFNAGTVKETQTLTFDAFGRELSTQWTSSGEPGGVSPRSDVWTNQYDVQGRLRSVASPTGTVFYEYDIFGRQTRVMSRGAGFQPANANATDYETDIRYSYDSLGRLSKVETFERNNVAVDVDPNTAGNQPEAESYAYTLNGSLDYEINPDGSTTDYTYDELDRLTDLDEYRASTITPNVFTDNPKLAEYNYILRADGKKESADEIIYATDGTTAVSHTQFDWTYDNASRLTDEVFTDVGNLMADVDNYHTSFEYDLTGNRLTQTTITDTNQDGVLNAAVDRDEVTTYSSDVNDRMLSESTVVDGVGTESTAYGYTGTQQTSKSVVSQIPNTQISNQTFSYDLQGRMYQATTETFNAGTLTSRNRATYQYGTDGIRYRAISESDTVLSLNAENWQLTTDTKYLIDAHNHTGYQQVLQESVTDANGNLIRKIVYTIGLDHISQTTFTPGGPAQGTTAVFHMDGHGSTRILTDLAGAILNIGGFAQIYHYTAYGEAINFQMANAGTQYLYSGEQFDARIGQQYLRARYYDQANGTFNRLDPFFGNQTDPQSFHKYRYTHGDPISHADPTGNFDGLIGLIGNMSARVQIAATDFAISSQILFYSSGPAIGTYLLWNSITDTLTGIKALSTGRDGDGQTLTAGGWLLALLAVSMELMPGETEDVFKSLVNYRGLIGFPTMYSGFRKVDGTVAMLRMDGKDYYGASGWIGRTQRSLLDIKDWLIEKGVRSNAITPTHAEGHVFAEALLETGSSVSKKAELFIDQTFCKPCGLNRGLLSYCQALGIEELVVNIRLADGSVLQGLYDLSKVD